MVGSLAIYLLVLNQLPVHPKNASLLLLSKGKKQAEYCNWLLSEHSGLTLQEKQNFIYYLFKYRLIEETEVEKEMRRQLLYSPNDYEWLLDLFDKDHDDEAEEHKARFLKQALKRILDADTPIEVAQKILHANSPVELALKAIQNEEQRRELLARLQQSSYQTVSTSTQPA